MSRQWLIALLICFGIGNAVLGQSVPDRITYCGMELTISPGARAKIAEYVENMYISPRYFNDMVRRADTYMPIIKEGLQNVRAPLDLRFISIQESGLRADAVSTSNAVGFWQFKAPVAREVGLQVDEQIDERKHAFRASEAAGLYFAKANRDFDNWVYAVIAYYEGPTGAIPYTDPKFYGKKEMVISEDLHWYVLKAIAHKLAYEEAIAIRKRPDIWLLPLPTDGSENVRKLHQEYGIDEGLFLQYNQWISEHKRLPKGESFTYYIPRAGETYAGHIPDPNKVPGGGRPGPMLASTAPYTGEVPNLPHQPDPKPVAESKPVREEIPVSPENINTEPIKTQPSQGRPDNSSLPATTVAPNRPAGIPTPKAQSVMRLLRNEYADFPLTEDLEYGKSYVLYNGSRSLLQTAAEYGKRLTQLLEWNFMIPGQEPKPGTLLFLSHPSRVGFHVVREGDNLGHIAAIHYTTIRKIQKNNRMSKGELTIYVGQKLYLKSKKPKGEKMIVLTDDLIIRNSPPEVVENPAPTSPPVTSKPDPVIPSESANSATTSAPPAPQNEVEDVRTYWVEHTVKPGETLWAISKQYNTKVEIIKVINKLGTDDISEGQILRILARDE